MKIDPVVARETRYVAGVCLVLSVLMQGVFLLVNQAGWLSWHWSVLPGNLLGITAAVGNFFLMGLTVQAATSLEEKTAKTRMRASYACRCGLLLLICVIGAVVAKTTDHTCFLFAVIVPLLFPRVSFALRQLIFVKK